LQELIAPEIVEFYDRNWNEIGTKMSLKEKISRATFIPMNPRVIALQQFYHGQLDEELHT
jgi:hypothetical protein